MQIIQWFACISVLLTTVLCDKKDICKVVETSCGPVPPILPENFILKGSKLDLLSKDVTWFEEYFDPDNLRAKYVEVAEGIENHYIFDYQNLQIISYFKQHPGASPDKDPVTELSCMVQDMDESVFTNIIGKKYGYWDTLRSRMYNSYESLRYGGQYSYAYVQNATLDKDRNVPCMTFEGCVYDETEDATYYMNFVWSTKNLAPSFNMDPTLLKIQEKGGYYSSKEGADPVWKPEESDKSVAWFESNPYLPDEYFQPPVRMECRDMRSSNDQPPPPMPLYFSTRMETFLSVEDWKGKMIKLTQDMYQELWYDSGYNLIRHDHEPSLLETIKLFEQFDKTSLVTGVHDFNSGISFYTDKVQGVCVSMPILYMPDSLILSKLSTEGNVVMATPKEVLGIDETLTYKGKYLIRDMDTKGYSGKVNNTAPDGKDPVPLLREIYFSSEGWHEDVDGEENFDVPLRDIQTYSININGQAALSIAETNYYNFRPSKPALSVYDISACADLMNKKYFQVEIKAENKPSEMEDKQVLDTYYEEFLNSAQQTLTESAGVGSPLRMQDLIVEYPTAGKILLKFTILDIFASKSSVSSPLFGLSLDNARDALLAKINTGTASIFFVSAPPFNTKIEYKLIPKSLAEIKKVTYIEDLSSEVRLDTTFSTNQGKKLYSNGAAIGLAIGMIVVGLGLGAGLMIIYFKKFMKPRNDLETADFGLNEIST